MSGWNKPNEKKVEERGRGRQRNVHLKGLLAGAAVVGLSLGVLWMFSGNDAAQDSKHEARRSLIKEVKPAAAPKAVAEDPQETDRKRRAKLAKMTPQERRELLMQRIEKEPLDLAPVSNRVFKTGFEQQVALIFRTELGNPPPFLAKIPTREEAHLAEILMNRVDPNETDSETIREAKEVVELAKKELRAYIKEGGNVHDFLEYYHAKLTQAFHERSEAQSSVIRVINEDPSIAVDYINKVNARLDEKGIRHVTVPVRLAEQIGYVEKETSGSEKGKQQ